MSLWQWCIQSILTISSMLQAQCSPNLPLNLDGCEHPIAALLFKRQTLPQIYYQMRFSIFKVLFPE
jgi:hypothetical protein